MERVANKIKSYLSTRKDSSKLLIIPLTGLFIFLFILPLSRLFWISINENGNFDAYKYVLTHEVFQKVFLNTAILSLETASITLIICFPVTFLLINVNKKITSLILSIIMLPFWMSILVRSFAWIVIFQKEGVLNQILQTFGIAKLSLLYTRFSVLTGMVYVFIPYVILILHSGFLKVNKHLINTGFSLGTSKLENFCRVFLPQVSSNTVISFLYVFIISFGYFITPALLGGGKDTTISMLIDIDMNQTLNWSQGAAISFLILSIVISLILISALFLRKQTAI